MIAFARERAGGQGLRTVTFLAEDFLKYPVKDASFDFVCANTVLHHMDFAAALAKMARILRLGGRLAVVGLAREGSPADWLVAAAGIPANWFYKLTRGEGTSGAPVMDPDMTWAQVRSTARRVLPGVRYRRHLLWRCSLLWNKPV